MPEDVFQVLPGKGSVVGQRFVDHPDVAKIVFTGSTEVGRQIMAGCAAADQAGDARARRQERQRGVRRRRPRDGRRHAPRTPSSTTPARTAAPARGSWSSASAYDRFMELFEPAVKGGRGHRPGRREGRDGTADQCRAARPGRRPTCPTTRRSPSAAAPRTGRVTGSRRPCSPRPIRPTARCTRRSSARSSPSCRSTTRRTPIAHRQRQRRSACPARSGPATSAGRCGSAAASSPATSSVNSHSSVRYWTPFGGFKSSGLGRELGPDAPFAFTETKNVFISTKEN